MRARFLLTEAIEFHYRKIFWQFFLYVKNRVFNVESYDFTRGQFDQRKMREHGKALEYELMLVMFDNGRCFSEKIGRRTDGYSVVIQFIRIVRIQVAFVYRALSRVNSVSYTGAP